MFCAFFLASKCLKMQFHQDQMMLTGCLPEQFGSQYNHAICHSLERRYWYKVHCNSMYIVAHDLKISGNAEAMFSVSFRIFEAIAIKSLRWWTTLDDWALVTFSHPPWSKQLASEILCWMLKRWSFVWKPFVQALSKLFAECEMNSTFSR